MKSLPFARLARWLNLPAGVLIALLQRTPIVRIAMGGAEEGLLASTGTVLRSVFAVAATVGCLDTLVGATTIVSSPASPLTVPAGKAISGAAFSVPGAEDVSSWQVTSGSAIPPGLNVSGLTAPGVVNVETEIATLTGTPTTPGTYRFTLVAWEDPNGQGLSTPASTYTVVVTGTAATPAFTTQPASVNVVTGATVSFNVIATKATSYQWKLAGQNVSQGNDIGATTPTLLITNIQGPNIGPYTCVATNSAGSTTSTAANLTTTDPATPGHLVNLSILSFITGNPSMGFVTGGGGTSGSQPLLIRAVGPSLAGAPFNIPNVMPDPTLTVLQRNPSLTVGANAGWGTPPGNVAIINLADQGTGAFALTNPASLDSALDLNLAEVSGGYSAVVSGKSGDGGNAITEVYDNSAAYSATAPRLVNLSCLTQIAAGGTLDVGFVLAGATARTVLVRVGGPVLAGSPFNVPGTMPDPQMVLTPLSDSTQVLAADAGWGGAPALVNVAATEGAFAFPNPASADSAVLATLQPGVPYTVQVNSVSGVGGTVLVEIYDVP